MTSWFPSSSLYLPHLLSLTHLLLIHSISLSSFLLHLMPFHSFAPPLSSHLISRSLSTWDIEAIKTGVQKKAGPANPFYMPAGIIHWNKEREETLWSIISKSQLLFLWQYYVELRKEEPSFLETIKSFVFTTWDINIHFTLLPFCSI